MYTVDVHIALYFVQLCQFCFTVCLMQCLHTTFSIGSPSSDVIVAMGDNDIGGEGRDHMSDSVIRRYRDSFGKMNSVLRVGNVQIVKV